MSLAGLMRESVTFSRVTGENAQGEAQTETVNTVSAYFALTLRQRQAIEGPVNSGAGTLVLPAGTDARVGDSVLHGSDLLRVASVNALTNPRTGVASHVEVLAV